MNRHFSRTLLAGGLFLAAASGRAQDVPVAAPPKPAPAAAAPAPARLPRLTVVLDGGFALAQPTLESTRVFQEYAENTTVSTTQKVKSGLAPAAALQVRLFRGLGVVLGYSTSTRGADGTVQVQRPHPLYLAQPRSASTPLSGYDYKESGLDLDLAWIARRGKLDWSVFGGVTLFSVQVDMLSRPVYADSYPYDELKITSTPSSAVKDDPAGFNVGLRCGWRFARSVGAGLSLRYATASVELAPTSDSKPTKLDAGGLQAALGVRLYF